MKLFISVPTNGRADGEVDAEKAAILDRIRAAYGEPVELIDSYVSEDAPVSGDRAGAWYLGESIKRLATADVACFAGGWKEARGCRLEFSVCKRYGIRVIANSELDEIMNYADALQQSAKERPDETPCGFWRTMNGRTRRESVPDTQHPRIRPVGRRGAAQGASRKESRPVP